MKKQKGNATDAASLRQKAEERLRLQNSLFPFFISAETKPAYKRFLEKVFSNKTNETCGITLTVNGHPPMHVILPVYTTPESESNTRMGILKPVKEVQINPEVSIAQSLIKLT